MPMLQDQQPSDTGISMIQQNAPQDKESLENEGGTAFTINADQVESAIRDQVDDRQEKDLDQLVDAGNDLLFGKDTHYQLMDSLQGSQDIGTDLGGGAFSLMAMIIKEKNGQVPGEVVLPAGVILLARVAEFLNESGMVQVTDDDFEQATHLFSVKIMDTFDPDFRNRMQQSTGLPQEATAQPQSAQQPQQAGLLGQ